MTSAENDQPKPVEPQSVEPRPFLTFSEAREITARRIEQERAAVREAFEQSTHTFTPQERQIIADYLAGVPSEETRATLRIGKKRLQQYRARIRNNNIPLPQEKRGPAGPYK